jgi:hypothetical protein
MAKGLHYMWDGPTVVNLIFLWNLVMQLHKVIKSPHFPFNQAQMLVYLLNNDHPKYMQLMEGRKEGKKEKAKYLQI